MGAASAEASNNPTCGSRLANRTRSPADSDPSGALSRKISGWIVPKTERRGPGNAGSAGRACVPADLSTNPRIIAAISKRNRAKPQLNQYAPQLLPPLPLAQGPTGTVRPPTQAEASMLIAVKIVWIDPVGGPRGCSPLRVL